MIKVMKQQDQTVIFEVEGKINSSDYEVLTPTVEEVVDKHGYANLLLIAKGVKGETLSAMKKDAKFGFGVYKDVKKFALVTDQEWLRAAVHIMSPFTKTEEKVFDLDQQSEAETWLNS